MDPPDESLLRLIEADTNVFDAQAAFVPFAEEEEAPKKKMVG